MPIYRSVESCWLSTFSLPPVKALCFTRHSVLAVTSEFVEFGLLKLALLGDIISDELVERLNDEAAIIVTNDKEHWSLSKHDNNPSNNNSCIGNIYRESANARKNHVCFYLGLKKL